MNGATEGRGEPGSDPSPDQLSRPTLGSKDKFRPKLTR